jgi:hypothetical protein
MKPTEPPGMAKIIRLFSERRTIRRIFWGSSDGQKVIWLHADDLIRWIAESEMPNDWKEPIVEAFQFLRDAR